MSSSRRRTRVLAAGAVTAAVALAAGGYSVANAAAEPPPIAFVAATPNVVAERYVDDEYTWLYLDLGVNLIAGAEPLEIRATRRSYADPIVAQRIVTGGNGKKKAVTLPAGFVDDFGGFSDFTSITIRNAAGATVKQYDTDFCPNTWGSARTRRDAPAQNPYPRSCAGGNPFLLGAVWGVQAGWNATTESMPRYEDEEPDFDIPAGTYTATVKLNDKYASYFKIPASSATVKLGLTVVDTGPEDGQGLAAAKARTRAAAVGDRISAEAALSGEHGEHAGQGDAKHQVSAYAPGFRPPARAPKVLTVRPRSGPKPDLRSLPAWGISLAQDDDKAYVNFGATVWNAGTSPLLVDGFRRTGTELMDAYQYFFDSTGKEVGSVAAGTMEWDARQGHQHWHFTDFAQYRLLSSDKKLTVKSGKEAFCLANTDAVDYTLPSAKWRPDNTDLSSSCGQNTAVAVREVLDIGNGDTYSQDRPGQSFEVTGLPNGTYYIEVLANPSKKLSELSTGNNSALRKIVLGGTPGARTLKVPAVYGIEG